MLKPLILAIVLGATACAIPSKTIVLRNMPSTIIINRGDDVSEMQCKKTGLWGCAGFRDDDTCEMSLDWDRGIGVTIHELAHCSGADEKEAQALTAPELE